MRYKLLFFYMIKIDGYTDELYRVEDVGLGYIMQLGNLCKNYG